MHVWLLPPALPSWWLVPCRLHWSPTLTGLWWLSHQCTPGILRFAVFLNEKLGLWLCFACWPFLTAPFSGFLAGETPELVWVPFLIPGLLELCQLEYLRQSLSPLLDPSVQRATTNQRYLQSPVHQQRKFTSLPTAVVSALTFVERLHQVFTQFCPPFQSKHGA